jgi:hypothetical protein
VAGWDSFRQVEIVMLAHDVFNMQYRGLDSMANVGDLVRVIATKWQDLRRVFINPVLQARPVERPLRSESD